MKIVLASNNKKKIRELETLLAEIASNETEVLSLSDIGYTDEIVEDGNSFQENALIKAAAVASLGYIGVADDSGLMVDALDGAPGIYSARYSGEGASDAGNNAKLLREMQNVPDGQRSAKFVSVIACVLPEGLDAEIPADLLLRSREGLRAFAVRGECPGIILREQHGEGGFGYDPLFFVEEKGRTFAQLSAEEKNEISHRGVAMRGFGKAFTAVFHEKN